MAKLSVSDIRTLAEQIVIANPNGIRFSEIKRQILATHPATNPKTVQGVLSLFGTNPPASVTKPSRGLYAPAAAVPAAPPVPYAAPAPSAAPTLREEDFYDPFAQWLRDELDEVVVAGALGGASQRTRWGTPDVIGVYKPLAKHRLRFTPEIVSAEIKIDPQQPVVAFGQAIAYRLFSSKVYVVMPRTLSPVDLSRLEALCLLFGLGLVVFELDPADPSFDIRVRAQRAVPDMFYVNDFEDRLSRSDPSLYQLLFG